MKSIWQKILKFFSNEAGSPKQEPSKILTDEIIQNFISHPEDFTLFRGEGGRQSNEGGLHFTTNKEWAKNFGDTLLEGTLPKGSKIHLTDKEDYRVATNIMFHTKKIDETAIFKFQLEQNNYDAMLGHDQMNSNILDVVVNPKHLTRFKPSKLE